MRDLDRLTNRLAALDTERKRILLAIDVLHELDPTVAETPTRPERLAAKALARVNGHQAAPARHRRPLRTDKAAMQATQMLVTEWIRDQPRRPFSTTDLRKGLSNKIELTAERAWSTLKGLTTRNKYHPKLLKKVGQTWIWIGDRRTNLGRPHKHRKVVAQTRAAIQKQITKGRASVKKKPGRHTEAGEIRGAIIGLLKGRTTPTTFAEIRDTLRERGVIHTTQQAKGVSVVLHTSLLKKGVAILTPEGWLYNRDAVAVAG